MAINNKMPKLFDLFSINACNQFRIPTSGYTNKKCIVKSFDPQM